LLTLVHSGALRYASAQWLGKDYPWYLQAGVAGQYLLGPGLQPSVFGVLLLAAVHAFLRGRPWLAIVCVALAADSHSTYLLTCALGFSICGSLSRSCWCGAPCCSQSCRSCLCCRSR